MHKHKRLWQQKADRSEGKVRLDKTEMTDDDEGGGGGGGAAAE